ncbi:hypothetical protein WOLCODRAFT_165498 [Wolfiporia cocos MD-104 SS10]|uniref:Uncharacterized protein n=1 Tax=Wolfiporia cocos (strain MD-104) TaxID=742152 RepID=A0A2H3JY53_WOLCO|nr:hypothetical protein WOLCODRAFT_165498 [Wolfiporia cocos MD-104 SS10]
MSQSDFSVRLRQELSLPETYPVDEDASVALTSLIVSAARDQNPICNLRQLVDIITRIGGMSYLDALTLLPILLPHSRDGTEELLSLIGTECSGKEVIMAVQESLERLSVQNSSGDYADDEEEYTPAILQCSRAMWLYSDAIPRIPLHKKTTRDIVKPLLPELQSVIAQAGPDASASEGRALIRSASRLVTILSDLDKEQTDNDASGESAMRDLLASFLMSILETCTNDTGSKLASSAFEKHFPRLIIDPSAGAPASSDDIISQAWEALESLGLSFADMESKPSLGTFVLLAHTSYPFTMRSLASFFPIILTAIQANVALDEVISVLISTLVPLYSQTPRPEMQPNLIIPLAHVLPPLASVHPDPSTRLQIFRLFSVVLSLTPSPLRLQLLQGLLTDQDSSPQMRIATVGLVKDAVLEALAKPMGSADRNRDVFASRMFLQLLSPILWQLDPPDLFDSYNLSLSDFLETAEPLRLVECLALYYVLVNRDVQNGTGVRDKDNLRNIRRTLLDPLRRQFDRWDANTDAVSNHESYMQLGILEMWLERVNDISTTLVDT